MLLHLPEPSPLAYDPAQISPHTIFSFLVGLSCHCESFQTINNGQRVTIFTWHFPLFTIDSCSVLPVWHHRCCPDDLSPVKSFNTNLWATYSRTYNIFFALCSAAAAGLVCNQQFSSHNWRPFIRWSIWLSSHFSHLLLYVTSPPPTPKMCVPLRRMEKREREKNEFFMSPKWIHLGGDGKCVLFFISQISIHNTYVRSRAFRRRRENRMRYMREDVSHLMMANEAPNCRITHKTLFEDTENLAQQRSNGAN